MNPITSSQNSYFKLWKKSLIPRFQKKTKIFLLSGSKIVFEELKKPHFKGSIIGTRAHLKHTKKDKPFFLLTESLFKQLDILRTGGPLLAMPLPSIPVWKEHMPPQQIEVLLPISDPGNLGACLRSCAAFDIQNVILLKEASSPFHPKALKSASGTHNKLHFFSGPSIQDIKKADILLNTKGTFLKDFNWPKSGRLLLGEEGLGVPDSVNGQHICIETSQAVESLNVATSLGIALYSRKINHTS